MRVVVTAIVFILINDVLFAYNAVAYQDFGLAVSIARGCGLCLDFNSVAVIMLMLRKTMTWIRGTAIGPYLPLDQHIDLHKVIAWLIVVFGAGHTIAHFVNVGKLYEYSKAQNVYCYVCLILGLIANEPNATYAYWEYLLSTHTDVGWVNGSAGITGIILLLVLIVMVICSQPFVRRTGHFEVQSSMVGVPTSLIKVCVDLGLLLDSYAVCCLLRCSDSPCQRLLEVVSCARSCIRC